STLGFVVAETAGLRRFSYPVHTFLPDVAPAEGGFRLLRNGRPVPAQFRPVTQPDGRRSVALDFASNIGPLEKERYLVETNQAAGAGLEPTRGLRVEYNPGAFRIQSGSALHYLVDERLAGFLESVGNSGREYLESRSGGLYLRPAGQARPDAVLLGS